MSEKENAKIDQLSEDIKLIGLALRGDPNNGIEGVIPLLQRHTKESNENFKSFKRDLVKDYADNFNRVEGDIASINEGLFSFRKEIDAKVEKIDDRTKNTGYYLGVAAGIGAVGYFILDYLI